MAADSQANTNGRIFRTRKLYRARGALLGISGTLGEGLMFVDWYEHGADLGNRPVGMGCGVLVLDESGLYRYEDQCYPIPIIDDFAAAGSGTDIALAAMVMGKSPAQAVALACQIDLHTGTPVIVEQL